MPQEKTNRYILTGGPGAGKTTLLGHLGGQGIAVMPEAGRSIIRMQSQIDGQALPWRDRALFAEQMLAWELRSYEAAASLSGPVLFDRGLPDIVGYLRLEGLGVPAHISRAAQAFRYNPSVFIAPPWPEIFVQDAERRQDLETAERTYEAMVSTYRELGYALIELPRAPVGERASFMNARISG
ncbi:AAA family ATPase [Hyphomonas sp. WL0036]|uniref:AAA family ATPase n=1 Tax=Hyphomonas sediminis TaxID=2866160 RepID=UPI001C7E5FBA|nr:AAA family ATPase [Hyphomonas sediminis]MBY9065441.1 AAA family ATPase [Hyphomonas sediminis]